MDKMTRASCNWYGRTSRDLMPRATSNRSKVLISVNTRLRRSTRRSMRFCKPSKSNVGPVDKSIVDVLENGKAAIASIMGTMTLSQSGSKMTKISKRTKGVFKYRNLKFPAAYHRRKKSDAKSKLMAAKEFSIPT